MNEKRKNYENKIPGGLFHYLRWVRTQFGFSYKKWDSKRIAFVSVLISISVVFFIISVRILPINALPSYKFSFIGLPVKITGFIFGPVVGIITGVLADLISFLLVPSYYHYLYTIAIAIAGFIPGLCGYYFFNLNEMFFSSKYRIYKYKEIISFFQKKYDEALLKGNSIDIQYFSEEIAFYEVKIIMLENRKKPTAMINFAFVSTLIVLTIQGILIFVIFSRIPAENFENNRFIKNKLFYIFLTSLGFIVMFVFAIFYRVFLKGKYRTFIEIMAIISLSAILEFANTMLLAIADTITLKVDFWINLTQHASTGPIKIFWNLSIILATYKVVYPLISSKEGARL
ncbi:ECF transporter S component [Metamycoplasma hyosynoviae]|uniref:ECF transporter S component n=1 Tax=Metamycoplasma hyosynoviae TaxID=29559 RepID=UPI002359CE7D|nr:ECF transporter S component [Metamycoplasma hyosynoviae]MDC8920130.1 ECF transporter S component [Metamycoplasma hyosynoviae]MDD1366286.1 ECF transporter S component [Metamycoplasma hyosynoviae]MDD7848135.1 ECF transporter S component [Metamycoplasma hyosynoviae]MDD7895229.1 ECF transporter S component [Metamycoplasma hyosynoviae]